MMMGLGAASPQCPFVPQETLAGNEMLSATAVSPPSSGDTAEILRGTGVNY
jgi:hypothetical protein